MLGNRAKSAVALLMLYVSRLGSFYVVGIMLAMAAPFGFGELPEEALEGDVRPGNEAVLQSLHAQSNPYLDRLAQVLSMLGGVAGTTVVACLAGAFSLLRRRFFDAVTLGSAMSPPVDRWPSFAWLAVLRRGIRLHGAL